MFSVIHRTWPIRAHSRECSPRSGHWPRCATGGRRRKGMELVEPGAEELNRCSPRPSPGGKGRGLNGGLPGFEL
jgi:hypothetical protein